jgi:Domain of unknown function (DUF4340)
LPGAARQPLMNRYLVTTSMALVLGGLAAYLYFVELPAERSKQQTETEEKQLLPFDEHDVSGLTIRSLSGEVMIVQGDKGNWKIVSPVATEADRREVDTVIRALTLGKVSRLMEEQPGTLEPFGLQNPSVVLIVNAGSRQETISLGDSGPISSTLYAMRGSDSKVLLTDLAAKDFVNKTVFTFRKKNVLRFEFPQVERVRLTYPTSEIVLYRIDDQAGKNTKKWQIRFPVEAPADQPEVRSLLFKLEDLKALGFVDPGPERERLAKSLAKPQVKITIHAEGADQSVKLYQPDATSGEAYAVTTAEAPIYRIAPALIKELQKDLFMLQDKRLLGMEQEDLGRLLVKSRDEQYTVVNQSGTWVLEEKPDAKLNQETVDLFVSRVVNLPAEIRVVKQPGPLAPYGLASPSLVFTATTRDGKRQGRLVIGNRVNGLVYVMGQALPGILEARSDILGQVPTKSDLIAGSGAKPHQ